MTLTVVIGGTRSGKSLHAERLAEASGLPVTYLATADSSDPTMAERIAAHTARRPRTWRTIELGERVPSPLGGCVLLDGLGVWIASVMRRDSARVRERVFEQLRLLVEHGVDRGAVIVVAEQAGEGLLPAEASSRAWLDLLGEAVQMLSVAAHRVEMVVAGRAVALSRSTSGPCTDAHPAGARCAGAHARCAGAHSAGRLPLALDPGLRRHGDAAVRPGDADHAVNVMADGPPAWLRVALHEALETEASRYPDERQACEAVALAHGRAAEEVVPTNGAAEALWLLPAALAPRLAACIHPAFTESEAALRAHGVSLVRVLRDPDAGFALDPAAVPADADVVIAGNPASPCGTLTAAATMLALRRPRRTLVVDEAFMDLVPGEPCSLARQRLDGVIVLRSLTKSLSIPGLRAGYALAPPGLAERLRAVRPPWSANALALAALIAAARRPDALAALAKRARDECDDLSARLTALPGVRAWRSATNFCLIEVRDGPAVLAALRQRSIAVRPAASFPGLGGNHLRITARDAQANKRLAEALREAVAACL